MTKHFKFSKGLHVLTLCCFLMPFFYTSCDKEDPEEVTSVDTVTKVETAGSDSADISNYVGSKNPQHKENSSSFIDNDSLFKKAPFLRPFLNPCKDEYSGIGIIITHLSLIVTACVFFSFILLLISLTIKFFEKNAKKTIVLLDIIGLIALLVSKPFASYYERLWGLWVCVTFISLLTIYDIYIARLSSQQDKEGSS